MEMTIGILIGIAAGIVLSSIGWVIFAVKLNDDWTDLCLKNNKEWNEYCEHLIEEYYGATKEGDAE